MTAHLLRGQPDSRGMKYVLRVTDKDGDDADEGVSKKALNDVDSLFTEICRNIVKAELRLQGEVPQELYSHLSILSDGALAADARRFTDETLDYLGGPGHGTWMSDTYPDAVGRKRIARQVLELHRDLEGMKLVHGPEGEEREFSDLDTVWVTGIANAMTRAVNGGIMGVVVKNPQRRDHWALSDGESLIPLVFIAGTSRYSVDDFLNAGPVIAVGTVIRDEQDAITELRAVDNCYTFPGAVFLRAIASGRDVGLVYPLEGATGFYARNGTWYLKNDELAIEASGRSWNECVMAFHRAFVDLWNAHRDGTAEPNARIHGILDRMCPFEEGPADQ